MEEEESVWYPYEQGETISRVGPAGGYVLRDEEWGDPEDPEDADARVTLEQGGAETPGFYITATLYGWMHHTHRRDTAEEGQAAYETIIAELTRLILLIPYEEDGAAKVAQKARELSEEIAVFERRFA